MAETQHQGVMAMVKIDGDKVKQLREQKGLTQLYVATVVQVTTDTISRWENKRYPTIKKENGVRLAEALEVDLEEILMIDEESAEQQETEEEPVAARGPAPPPASGSRWPVLIIFFLVAALLTAGGFLLLRRPKPLEISARRILPLQCTAGQPFPVAIEVTGPQTVTLSVIVKEQLPETMAILATEPPLPSTKSKNLSLKWLKKIEGNALFTYIATLDEPLRTGQAFSGSVASGGDSGGESVAVTGPESIQVNTYHWADGNGDNVISDQEILAVYDQYGDLEKLGIDVDLIEEIWLGSGYRWNEKKKTYEILP